MDSKINAAISETFELRPTSAHEVSGLQSRMRVWRYESVDFRLGTMAWVPIDWWQQPLVLLMEMGRGGLDLKLSDLDCSFESRLRGSIIAKFCEWKGIACDDR